jgi:hypothetical protein
VGYNLAICRTVALRGVGAAQLALAIAISKGGVAYAQPAPEKPPPEKAADEKAPPSDAPLPAPEPPPVTTALSPAPPLAPPRADEQEPRPYTRVPDPRRPLRNVDIGPDFGVAARPSGRDSVSYGAGFAIGGHVRLELAEWLGFRALFARVDHPVSITRGGLGLPNTDAHQPDLELVLVAGRIEPTWVVSRKLRLWAGAGGGIAYFVAPIATSTGSFQIQSARRTGAAPEVGAALGATFDVIPDWFTVALSGSAAFTFSQTGDAFEPTQSFDATGRRYYTAALPEFAGSFAATASLGLLL